ncbi:MAG TPA: RNA polymerase sigma factor [Candidimonas sp.]|nr:RNA polymerase sigma factor [Candidimonas sp.]
MSLALVKPIDENRSDAYLAQRVAAGERTALESMMRRYNQRLYRVARSILRSEADAEEVVQDAFFKAYRAISTFRGDASLSTWLVRIVVNESNRRLRKINRLSTWLEFNSDARDDEMTAETTTGDDRSNQPEPIVLRSEQRALIESCIDELPDLFRSVFVMRAIEELTVEETAVCLSIPAATVRSRYFRARKQLRQRLRNGETNDTANAFSFAGDRCDRIVAGVMARVDRLAETNKR